jgi:hypothetical protein
MSKTTVFEAAKGALLQPPSLPEIPRKLTTEEMMRNVEANYARAMEEGAYLHPNRRGDKHVLQKREAAKRAQLGPAAAATSQKEQQSKKFKNPRSKKPQTKTAAQRDEEWFAKRQAAASAARASSAVTQSHPYGVEYIDVQGKVQLDYSTKYFPHNPRKTESPLPSDFAPDPFSTAPHPDGCGCVKCECYLYENGSY